MRNNKGFSLVELIVVIAIMAILAAVAVIGVSVYIPKAQKAADQQMFSDIEDTLIYAGYAGTFEEGEAGYIILTTSGIKNADEIKEGSNLDKALKDTFGADYKTSLKLSYDGWASNGLYDNLTPETAYAVSNSSYLTGSRADDLLKDVEIMTSMAQNLVTVLGEGTGVTEGMTLSQMFTKDGVCAIDATAAKYGITKDENKTWEEWANESPENKAAYSNLLVMTAADESDQHMSGIMGTGDAYEMTGASNMILEFSSFYAYAAITPAFSETLDKYMAHLNVTEENDPNRIPELALVTDAKTGAAWYSALTTAAGPGYEEYMTKGRAETDKLGFLSIMGGIGNPSEEQANQVADGLSQSNLFTEGVVNGMYKDFLDGVDAVSGSYYEYDDNGDSADWSEWSMELGEGSVVIFYTQRDGSTKIRTSIPSN